MVGGGTICKVFMFPLHDTFLKLPVGSHRISYLCAFFVYHEKKSAAGTSAFAIRGDWYDVTDAQVQSSCRPN